MRTILIGLFMLMLEITGMTAQIKNIDRPLNGEWDFKMKLDWRVNQAGDNFFTVIEGLVAPEDGTVYILDRKSAKVYILDKQGKLIKAFGKIGEGPGEFGKVRKLFLMEGQLIVVDDRNIHYFTPLGKYRKSVLNNYMQFPPAAFINLDMFISVTVFADPNISGKKGKISQYDLKEKNENIISYFQVFDKGSVKIGSPGDYRVFSFSVSSLTPRMVLYHHKDMLYTAMSDRFLVKVTDLAGKEIRSFSLSRGRTKVTAEYKEKFVSGFPFPDEAKVEARKNLPDYLNLIEEIYVDENGFIYILEPVYMSNNSQHVDIFSNEGVYLYTSGITVGSPHTISSVYFSTGKMYVLSEDESGDIYLAKYSIRLPGSGEK